MTYFLQIIIKCRVRVKIVSIFPFTLLLFLIISLGSIVVVNCEPIDMFKKLASAGSRAIEAIKENSPNMPPMDGSHSKSDSDSSRSADVNRARGGGEIGGFLGIESLANPIIALRKTPADSPIPEPECARTYYMGPFSEPKTFFSNGSVGSRMDPSCYWYLIGTEPCIPMLDCPHFKLTNTDDICEEYLEVSDGHLGRQTFCGDVGPANITAYGGLRDLYIRYKTVKHVGKMDSEKASAIKFSCRITCAQRGEGTPIPKAVEPNMNLLCHCGQRPNGNQNRIVNGEAAVKGEFPWIAALVRKNTRQPFCGASIINDRMILTAAHCIKGMFMQIQNLEVVLGGHLLDELPNMNVIKDREKGKPKTYEPAVLAELDAGNNSVRFGLEQIIIHPLYVTETNDFDVALLRLSTPIDFLNYTQLVPACLPRVGSYLRTYAKREAIVAGWGLADEKGSGTIKELQKLTINVFTPKACKQFYAHRVNRRMLCAGHEEGGKDSCMGDSGGPLVHEERPNVWYQIGTVSWGEGCAAAKNPGAYIRMTEVGQWIHYHSNFNDAVWCALPKRT